jgi:hypothetical protein
VSTLSTAKAVNLLGTAPKSAKSAKKKTFLTNISAEKSKLAENISNQPKTIKVQRNSSKGAILNVKKTRKIAYKILDAVSSGSGKLHELSYR